MNRSWEAKAQISVYGKGFVVQIPLMTEFNRYLDAIQPTKAQRDLAKNELSFLETKLREFIQDDDPYRFVKALRSGSFAKATALRRTEVADFDADIAVYVEIDDEDAADIVNLVEYTEKLVKRAYKQRTTRRPRFETNESCVRVVFNVTPKINIDIVPIVSIKHEFIPNWGLLPKRDGTSCHTSVSEHIEFVKSRNDRDASVPFRKIVRLFKVWRNGAFRGEDQVKARSFLLELVLGKAYDEQRSRMTGQALPDFSRMAAWIIKHGLESPIVFPAYHVPPATVTHSSPVIILDPINRNDNVASDWTTADLDRFLDRLDELRDLLRDAELEAEHDLDTAIAFIDRVLPNFSSFSKE